MYKFNLILLVVFVLFLDLSLTNADDHRNKVEQLIRLSQQAHSHLIPFNNAEFQHFIQTKPRNYGIIALFTTSNRKVQCHICGKIESELKILSSSYEPQEKDQNLFFVKFDHMTSIDAFKHFDLTGVPLILYIPPYSSDNNQEFDAKNKFLIQPQTTAEDISSFVHSRANIKINIVRSQVGVYITLFIFFGILLGSIRFLIDKLPEILKLIRNRYIWMAICGGFYLCSISGLVYDIIHKPPPFYLNIQTGQFAIFHPQSRSQFVIEGFVIGFLNFACAACLIALVVYIPQSKFDETIRKYSSMGLIFGFLFCFYQISQFYVLKNRWYLR